MNFLLFNVWFDKFYGFMVIFINIFKIEPTENANIYGILEQHEHCNYKLKW